MSSRKARISEKVYKKNNTTSSRGGPHNVLHSYQMHEMSRDFAIKKLSYMGTSGRLFAGQLLIEKSARAESSDESIEILGEAAYQFKEAEIAFDQRHEAKSKKSDLYRARLFLGYLPIFAFMNSEKTFPTPDAAESAYQKTVNIGYEVLGEILDHNINTDSYKKRSNLIGLLGEISVLGLTNRAAVYDIGSDTYFALPATVEYDRANRHGTTVDRSSDINVFCDNVGLDDPAYKLAIKNSNNRYEGLNKYALGKNVRINVTPDLEKNPDELYVASEIMKELYSEMSGISYYPEVTESLDYRTEKLFDIFDNPPTNS
jgi:hypothetical protein